MIKDAGRGQARGAGDDHDLGAYGAHGCEITSMQGLDGIVASLCPDSRANEGEEMGCIMLPVHINGIDRLQGGNEPGSGFLVVDRPVFAFQKPNHLIGVHTNDQAVTQRPRTFEVAGMTVMQDVETTVGRDNSLSGEVLRLAKPHKLTLR